MSVFSSLFGFAGAQGRVGAKPGLRVTPTGAGSKSGDDWSNAMAFSSMNSAISKARSQGYDVWLHADLGDYKDATLSITQGGIGDADRVAIRSVDATGAPKRCRIVGTRANPWSVGLANGNSSGTFLLLLGANNLSFYNIGFFNCGTGCFRFGANIQNITIQDCYAENVRTFQENTASGGNKDASCENIAIKNCRAIGYSKCFGRFQYNSFNILYEDCWGDSQFQDGDPFAFGIPLNNKAHDVRHINCTMINHRDSTHGTGYWNSDGFSAERGNYNLYYKNCYAGHNTDGGWDCKSTNTLLEDCVAEDNKRNYRLWGEVTLRRCKGINPSKPPVAQASLPGTGGSGYISQIGGYTHSRILADTCEFTQTNNSTAFVADDNGFICVDQYTLDHTTVPSGISKQNNSSITTEFDRVSGIWNHNDTTIPIITSAGTDSIPENSTKDFLVTANEPVTLEIVGGQNAANFSRAGRVLRLVNQDFENPINNPMRIDIRVVDANGNKSAIQSMAISITDVNDDPISVTEAFNYGNSAGCWYDVSQLNTLWADTSFITPAVIDGPVALIQDLSGFGNHATQEDIVRQGYLRTDGAGKYWIEADGFSTYYNMGVPGALKFTQATAVVAYNRDEDATGTDLFFSVPRAANASTPSFGLGALDTSSARAYVNPNVGAGSSGSPRRKNLVSSLRTTTGTVRTSVPSGSSYGMVQYIDLSDVNALAYSATYRPQARLFTGEFSGNLSNFYWGNFYGMCLLNQPCDDIKLQRLERQMGMINGVTL